MVTRALGEHHRRRACVFRVDLRLRPEGRSGAICNSLAAAERYYETFGRTWERQALLRARPCGGRPGAGRGVPAARSSPSSSRAPSGRRRSTRCWRCGGCSGTRPSGAGFDVKLGAGRHPRRRAGGAAAAAAARGQAARAARARAPCAALHKLTLAGLLTDQRAAGAGRRPTASCGGWSTGCSSSTAARPTRCRPNRPGWCGWPAGWDYPDAPRLRWRISARRCSGGAAPSSDTLGEPDVGAAGDGAAPAGPGLVARADRGRPARGRLPGCPAASADALELVQSRLPAAWLAEILGVARPRPGPGALPRAGPARVAGAVHLAARAAAPCCACWPSLFGTSERLSRHLLGHPQLWVPPGVEGLGAPHAGSGELAAGAARAPGRPGRGGGAAGDAALPGRGDPAHRHPRRGRQPRRPGGDRASCTTLAEVCLEAAVRQVAEPSGRALRHAPTPSWRCWRWAASARARPATAPTWIWSSSTRSRGPPNKGWTTRSGSPAWPSG